MINRRNFFSFCGSVSAGLALNNTVPAKSQPDEKILLTDDEKTKQLIAASRERLRELYFPNVELITHEGKKVKFYDDLIKDKVVTINFMYATCDGICPGITRNLAKAQDYLGELLGKDVFMYSITLKPILDTPEVLNDLAKSVKAKPGWLFLTGKPEDIELLRRKQGFVDPDPAIDKDKSQHTGNIRYGNEAMQYWGSCPGLGDPEVIVESLLWVDETLQAKYLAQREKQMNMKSVGKKDSHQHEQKKTKSGRPARGKKKGGGK